MKKHIKSIIVSSVAALSFGAISVGTTFALFTDKSETTIEVGSGKIDVSLTASGLHTFSAEYNETGTHAQDERGYKYNSVATAVEGTFTNSGTAVLDNDGKLTLSHITPGDRVTFDVALGNNSNVAFKYRLSYEAISEDKTLAAPLVTKTNLGESEVKTYNGLTKYVTEWIYNDGDDAIGGLSFDVELPIDTGNDYQNKTITFKLSIDAIQANAYVDDGKKIESIDLTANTSIKDNTASDLIVTASNAANDVTVTTTIASDTSQVAQGNAVTLKVGSIDKKDNAVDPDYTDLSFDITLLVNGVATEEFSKPVKVEINVGTGLGISSVTHNDTAVTDYTYNPEEGIIRFYTSNFSPFVVSYYDLPNTPIRIGKVGYNTLSAAIAGANNNDVIIFQEDYENSSSLTIGKSVVIDLGGNSLLNYANTTINADGSLTIKNGGVAFARGITTNNDSEVVLKDLSFNAFSSYMFQLYNKNHINISIDNCLITSKVDANNNNNCMVSMTGGTLDEIIIAISNSTINWNDDAWIKFHANAADKNVKATIDESTVGNHTLDEIAYSSSNIPNIQCLHQETNYVYKAISTGDWLDLVSGLTDAPEGYTENGDTISISTPLGLAWFSKLSQTNDFAGKTITLTDDIDLAFNKWTPISKLSNGGFAGTFDGNGHTISNMANYEAYLSSNSTYFGNGLFFRIGNGSIIRNLTVTKAALGIGKSYRAVGAISGYATGNVHLQNVHVTNSYIHGDMRLGAIIGMTEDPDGHIYFENCSSEYNVVEGYCNMGGFIGTMIGEASIDNNSYVVGNVFDERYSTGCPYATFDTTINDESSKYISNGTTITGRYHDYDGDDYYYGCWADFYIDYGGADCDPLLANGFRLANSEFDVNGSRVEDGKTYLN